MNQNTTLPVSSDGDRSGATRSMYSPMVLERSARSAPTFSSASFTTFASAFATKWPISRMIRKPTSLGR
jgi:hypothetical protein